MFLYYVDMAWRSLKRTPLVTILMICAIGIGIGVTMTSLSVYHMASMNPIPSKSDELYAVQINTMDDGETWWSADNLPYQLTYQDAMNLYREDLGIRKVPMMRSGFTVHMNKEGFKPFLAGTRVTGYDFFEMFELTFLYGGPWTASQEQASTPIVVISEELNERLFGGENSVGKEVYLDDTSFRISGVFKEWDTHIKYYDVNNGAFNNTEQVFVPITLMESMELETWGNSNGWKYQEVRTYKDRLNSEILWLQFWAELNTPEQKKKFESFLDGYLNEQSKLGRFTREGDSIFSLRDVMQWLEYNQVVDDDNRVLNGLSFMFLVVCLANILGLLLGKFLRRAPEVGVRRALGASKRDIFAQHIVEVSMLGFFGGLIGIGIAQLGLWMVRETYSYYSALATMDLSMLLAAPVLAIGACVIAGMYPAWLVCKTQPAIYLKTQ